MTPMQLGTAAETEIFGLAVTAGAFLGLIYGLFAVIRSTLKLKAVCFICDFLYAVMFGAVFFVFSLAQTGYVRGFILVSMLAGAVMWHFAIGRFGVRLISAVLNAVLRKTVMPIMGLIHKTSSVIHTRFVKNYTNLKE
jgi:hypothetical protein